MFNLFISSIILTIVIYCLELYQTLCMLAKFLFTLLKKLYFDKDMSNL